MAKCSHPALPPALWQIHTAGPYGDSVRPIQAFNTCRAATAHAQALPGGGLLAGGEVWFGIFINGLQFLDDFSKVICDLAYIILESSSVFSSGPFDVIRGSRRWLIIAGQEIKPSRHTYIENKANLQRCLRYTKLSQNTRKESLRTRRRWSKIKFLFRSFLSMQDVLD